MTTLNRAAQDVIAERERQVNAEGWTPEHDDKHDGCELAAAAACYAVGSRALTYAGAQIWPWHHHWWKFNGDYRRSLVKAAALLLAEIERIDRKELSK